MGKRYTLVIDAAGRCLLSTSEPLRPEELERVRGIFRQWSSDQPPTVGIVAECDIIRVESIDLRVDVVGASA